MLDLLLACVLASSEPGSEPAARAPPKVEEWHLAILAHAAYGSDVGFTLGTTLFPNKRGTPGGQGYRSATVGAEYSTRGPRSVFAGASAARLFGLRLEAHTRLVLADDRWMPYWGEGARLGGLPVSAGFGTPPDPYRYHDRRALWAGMLRGAVVGPLGWHVRARWLDVDVANASRLLATARPPGVSGGGVALGEMGLLWDTRDREVQSRRGTFATIAAFGSPRIGGVSDFVIHGYDAAVNAYLPVGSRLTLAFRALYDHKIGGGFGAGGAVPFFERLLYEGIASDDAFGSVPTLRGVARYHISGTEKALGIVQARTVLLTTHYSEATQEWGFNIAVETGWARQPGYAHVDAAALAGGLRLLLNPTLLLRAEVARAFRGGDATLYVAFGELF